MTIDKLIGELVRLSAASPHGGGTVVLLKFEGHVEIEGANLGSAQLPRGRSPKSPVVLILARTARRAPTRRMPGRTYESEEVPDDRTAQDIHAEVARSRLCREISRSIDVHDAATGDRSRPLEHLLRLIKSERFGKRWTSADAGQLWLSHDRSEAYFARATEICEKTGAIVIHSGSQAVYYRPDDRITIPSRKRFPGPAACFTTRFHETAHWAEKRVGWEGSRAEGELIAVLASFHLAQAACIPVADIGMYQEYHVDWLREIRSDGGFLARMLDQASKVADFILAIGGDERTR